MTQSWNAETLHEMVKRAYNYRYHKASKFEFEILFNFIEILKVAEKNNVDINTPDKFQNFIQKLRAEQERLDSEAYDNFRKNHKRPTEKKNPKLKKKHSMPFIFMGGKQVYPF